MELAVAAALLMPLSLIAIVIGWLVARKNEFHRRLTAMTAVLGIGSLTVFAIVGRRAYVEGWADFWLWLCSSHEPPTWSEWLWLIVVGFGVGWPTGFFMYHLYEHMAAKHPLNGPQSQSARRKRRLSSLASAAEHSSRVPLLIGTRMVLGPWLDGDREPSTRDGRWAVVPDDAHHLIVLGATGAGKSVTIERLVAASLAMGHRVLFIDGKEDESAGRRLAAMALAQGVDGQRIRTWPSGGPMDLWRGNAQQVLDRAHSLMEWTEPFYEQIAKTALRLAVSDPRGLPETLSEMIARLDSGYLKGTWAGTSFADVASRLTPELVAGVKLRYFGLDQALKTVGAVPSKDSDRGWSIDTCDFAYISLPTSTTPIVASGFGRAVLFDVMTWLRSPERRGDARPVLLVVEELGALVGNDEGTGRVIVEMLERARSANCRVILSGQSLGSFGSQDLAMRLLHSGASTICMRCSDPEQVLSLVGTRRQPEASLGVTVAGRFLDQGSMRIQEQFAISPDEMRSLPMGRAYLLHHGRFTLTQIAQIATDQRVHSFDGPAC